MLEKILNNFIGKNKEQEQTDMNTENPLSKDAINKLIKEVQYIIPSIDKMTTIAVIVTHGGFSIVGESHCFDPDNYDKKMGEEFALENAVMKLMEYQAFLLKHQ